MAKDIFYLICVLSVPLCFEMSNDNILPSDINLLTQPPRGCFVQIYDAIHPVARSKTNPEIPDKIREVGNCFLGTFGGMQLPEEPIVFKEVYFRKAHFQMYLSNDVGRSRRYIPSIVFKLDRFVIEANSKAVLNWDADWSLVERNIMETSYLSESASLTASQVLAKVLPILEHNNLSTDPNDYVISHNEYFRFKETVDFLNSTWRVQTAANDTEMDRITLWFSRCSGRLIRLRYYPSQTTIEQWYEYQNKGKV